MWVFNPDNRMQLSNTSTGASGKIKSTESRILKLLLENRGQVVSKELIVAGTWGDRIVSESSLTQAIAQLRLALGDNGKEQKIIKTIPKEGYLLIPEHVCLDVNYSGLKNVMIADSEAGETPVTPPAKAESTETGSLRSLPAWKSIGTKVLAFTVFMVSTLVFAWTASIYVQTQAVKISPWSVETINGINYHFGDSRVAGELYKELAGRLTKNISRVFISKNNDQFYVSCVYDSDMHHDKQMLNLTFTVDHTFDNIRELVNESCR